jgi:hypothetical protein
VSQQQFYETVQREQEFLETNKGQKMKSFKELREINVNEYVEKKGQLNYLSWTWAVDSLLQNDPMAEWEFPEPKVWNDTVMVFCNVTAMGKTMRMQLPVMDNRNNAIINPDTRKISDATMRCLAKCIACFGIGLYIYAGSDLPDVEPEPINTAPMINGMKQQTSLEALKESFKTAWKIVGKDDKAQAELKTAYDELKAKFPEVKNAD